MDIKPIRTEQDYDTAMERIGQLWGAPVGSSDGDELEVLSILVERYEEEHYPLPPSDPAAILVCDRLVASLAPRS